MARKPKFFNYEFEDGTVTVPTVYQAKCTVSGDTVPIYHKQLARLIENKYKNKFKIFVKTFARRGAVKEQREQKSSDQPDKYKLNAYSEYLVICYLSDSKLLEVTTDKDKRLELKNKIQQYGESFRRHFNRDITQYVKEE